MKTNFFKIAAIMLLAAGSFSSCKNNNPKENVCEDNCTANGRIIGYVNCYDNLGLFMITEQQDSLLSFNISPSSVNIDYTLLKFGSYGIENIDIAFTYKIACGEEIMQDFLCPQNAMDIPFLGGPVENYKQIIVTNITRQQP